MTVLSPIMDFLEEWRPDDAEGVEEAHGETEEHGGAETEGQDHGHGVQASTFLFVTSGSN